MAGVILETLSNRKLVIFGVVLLLVQIFFYLIGGLVAPAPYYAQNILATNCLDLGNHRHKDQWFIPRDHVHNQSCVAVNDLHEQSIIEQQITANQIVFALQFPLPRDNMNLKMSRWFQNIITVLQVDIDYDSKLPFVEDAEMTMEVRLGYRNEGDKNWTLIEDQTVVRTLHCDQPEKEEDGWRLQCDMLSFFELGSSHNDFYLVNIRLPVHEMKDINLDIMSIKDIWLVAIHQTGGFTKVWFSLKMVCFPTLLAVLVWYWNRITKQQRSPNLLEKMLFALGLAMSLLNLPIEWLTLWCYMPYMLLLTDIRQGIVYSFLLCFWVIFAGEHMMDSVERNRMTWYWKHLSAVAFGCICLFVFEMCERGVQLTNPFFSIWATETGSKLALTFIILAGIAASVYFLFLCYMVFRVFRNISSKKSSLPSMAKARRKFYMGLIYRFQFLMLGTLICAAITVIFFIIGEVSESQWKWGEKNHLEHTSAFLTGVYGMWNIYVFALLVLYAPSYKAVGEPEDDDDDSEQIEFASLPTDASALASFVTKAAAD